MLRCSIKWCRDGKWAFCSWTTWASQSWGQNSSLQKKNHCRWLGESLTRTKLTLSVMLLKLWPVLGPKQLISLCVSSLQEKISEDLRATLNAFLHRTGQHSNKYVCGWFLTWLIAGWGNKASHIYKWELPGILFSHMSEGRSEYQVVCQFFIYGVFLQGLEESSCQ